MAPPTIAREGGGVKHVRHTTPVNASVIMEDGTVKTGRPKNDARAVIHLFLCGSQPGTWKDVDETGNVNHTKEIHSTMLGNEALYQDQQQHEYIHS